MKKYFLSIFTLIIPIITFAQESTAEKFDAVFKKYTGWFVEGIFAEIHFTDDIQIPWVLFVLVGGALFFTI